MTLYQRLAGKHLRHDGELKVPLAAPTGVTGMSRTVVADLESHGMEAILHQCANAFNLGRRLARTLQELAPRWCSHSAWPTPSTASAIVSP